MSDILLTYQPSYNDTVIWKVGYKNRVMTGDDYLETVGYRTEIPEC